MDSSEPMLSVQNLGASYGGVPALHDVSFTVTRGAIVALIGSNGAGKTTTLRTISGLLRPDHGSIAFEGRRLDHLAGHSVAALGIAHVPEGRRLFTRLSVQQNLQLGAYTRTEPDAIRESMERVFTLFPRLRERANQRAGTLSGGEQQMLAIGRGLMLQPKLLMLDEPSLGIAPLLVEEIFRTIARINTEGVTVLLVEQNVRETLELATHAYVLQTGATTVSGTGRELLESALVRRAYLGL